MVSFFLKLFLVLGMTLALCSCTKENIFETDVQEIALTDVGVNPLTTVAPDSETEEGGIVTLNGYTLIMAEVDRMLCHDLQTLRERSDLVIVGRVLRTEQELIYEYNSTFDRDVIVNASTTGEIEVEAVLKGECSLDTVFVAQEYGYVEETKQLISFSEMTPMVEGDRWIFFLSYDENREVYWCLGDYTGRYPLPENLNDEVYDSLTALGKEKESWLSLKEVDTKDNILNENLDYYYDSDGLYYVLDEQSDKEQIAKLDEMLADCMEMAEGEDFGVYDKQSINLDLYYEILKQFGLLDR